MNFPITKDFNGKKWIKGYASGAGTTGVDDSIEFDPSNYNDELFGDPEKQVRGLYIDGNGNIQKGKTGTNVPPKKDEARKKILTVAQTELGWDKSKIRSVRSDQRTNLFFDYVVEGNYDGAKQEIDYIVNNTDLITSSEGQTFKDALDGKI